eukprot:m.17776 g.17776  ORF g.17776 m.17776 type:complete len:78 (+) comp4837_c0_seq1:866-1099(+)
MSMVVKLVELGVNVDVGCRTFLVASLVDLDITVQTIVFFTVAGWNAFLHHSKQRMKTITGAINWRGERIWMNMNEYG